MYITTSVLADWFQKAGIPCRIYGKEPWRFEDVRIYRQIERMDSKFLYLLEKGTVPSEHLRNVCFLWSIHDQAEWENYSSEKEEIVCCTKEPLLDQVQKCIFMYRKWSYMMNECLLNGGDLQHLIDISQKIFQNPIILDDTGFRVLACSQSYQTELSDAESQYVVQNGSHTPEYVREITEHAVFLENLKNNTGPFIYHYEFLEHESVYCPIILDGEPVAFLTIVGKNHRLCQSSIDLARLLAQALTKAFMMNGFLPSGQTPENHIMLSILHGESVDEQVATVCLERSRIVRGRQYYIVRLMPVQKLPGNVMIASRLKNYLRGRIAGAQILMEKEELVVIVWQQYFSGTSFSDMIRPLMESWNYRAGVSYPFKAGSPMNLYYRQAGRCVELANLLNLSDHVIPYEDIMTADLLSGNLSSREKHAAIHPDLLKLQQYDQEKGTELIRTLHVCMQCGYDVSIASEKLHVHKNTFYYRLRQISDLLGMNISKNTPSWFYVSLQLLQYISLLKM